MYKKLLLAAVAAGLVTATTLSPVQAGTMAGMSCKEAAKMQYPDDRKMRHDYKKACKEAWKSTQ